MKKVLFIIHEASETGAPLMILNLLASSYSKNHECFVLSSYGGKIEDGLKKNAKVSVLNKKTEKSIFNKIFRKIFIAKNDFLKKLDNDFFDVVYINSLACLNRLPDLEFLNKNKTILHVHEGPVLIENIGVHNILVKEIEKFSRLIFVSDFIRQSFNLRYNAQDIKQEIIPPVIRDLEKINSGTKYLNTTDNSFIVCSSGSLNYTKGVDVFLQVAKAVIEKAKENEPVLFIWIGTNGNAEIRNHFFNDIKKIGLEGKIKIIPNTADIINYFKESDVFFLSSREESFSMVAIENAILGNPVVCFDKGNGTTEFINNENGSVIPYLDIQAAANAILEMYNDRSYLKEKSEAVQKMAIKFSGNNSAKRIFEVIDEVINAS